MIQTQDKLRLGALAAAVTLALTACGGGGGGSNVRPTPPPATPPPTGPGFTPTIANDASLTQLAPPVIPAQAAPREFASQQLSQHLRLINAAGALGAGKTGSGVTIGFIDSGVDRNHPALTPRVLRNIMPPSSWTGYDRTVDDKVRHGTVVAMLAAGGSATGTFSGGETGTWPGGVAQTANIVSWRMIRDERPVDDGTNQGGNEIRAGDGYGEFFQALNADLANAGARIINNSWGGLYWNDPALTVELATAYKDFIVNRGGLVVFASGNSGDSTNPDLDNNPSDNAALPSQHGGDPVLEKGWLTVGALDPVNPTQLTAFSQKCGIAKNYCLVAPGIVVFPDYDANNVMRFYRGGGTSYAAPLVSGAAAVVWSAFPWMTNDQVRQTLLGTAKDLGDPGVDAVFGWGLLDVTKASNGPGTFAWGDFTANVASGHSIFRNAITGSGGLIKQGAGTLTLTEAGSYSGATQVQAGALDVRKGLKSDVGIANGGLLWAAGAFGGNVVNNGAMMVAAATPTSISGNYTQGGSANLGLWLGNALSVTGTASLGGTLSILGVKSGYTTTAKETLLTAGSVTGTFAQTRAAPNVFLDATVGYDAKNVFLNINRIDVSKAVAGMGLGGVTLASAQRMEGAMSAIDGQLALGGGAIGSDFIGGAGAFQAITGRQWADVSLRTLAGQVHAANAAMTQGALDAGRRAVSARVSDLAGMPRVAGTWTRDMASTGDLSRAGFDGIGMGSSGRLLGHDLRVGRDAIVGVAFSRAEQDGWLGAFGDSTRGLQHQTQWYAGWQRDGWQANAQLGLGGFDRFVERSVLVGNQFDRVGTRVSGEVRSLSGELGKRLDLGGFALMPYLGAARTQVRNDGFAEGGASGFGLRAQGWTADRSVAFAGLLGQRGWRWGGIDMALDARAEWQRTLASRGEAFAASYVGVEQWLPMAGMALAPHGASYGLGLSAAMGGSQFRFDLSQQATPLGGNRTLGVQLQRAF